MTVTVVHYHAPVIIGHCVELVVDNDTTICACANRLHAERIAQLLDRHGCLGGVHVHHILPRGRGGKHELTNLLTLCLGHHHWVHSQQTEARRLGVLR